MPPSPSRPSTRYGPTRSGSPGSSVAPVVITSSSRRPRGPAARARNRRVEVTFERVQQPAPPATTAPTTTAPTPDDPPASTSPIGTGNGLRELAGLTLEVLQVRRSSFYTLLLEVRIRNTGNGRGSLDAAVSDPDAKRLGTVDWLGVARGYDGEFYWLVLTDGAGTRYYTVGEDKELLRHCVCSFHSFATVAPDREIRLFALMTAPRPAPGG
jgi:hypothetical protein